MNGRLFTRLRKSLERSILDNPDITLIKMEQSFYDWLLGEYKYIMGKEAVPPVKFMGRPIVVDDTLTGGFVVVCGHRRI